MTYVYQEYPRLLYRDAETCLVGTDDEKGEALADGWRLSPETPVELADVVSVSPEVPMPKRRGRPPKVRE